MPRFKKKEPPFPDRLLTEEELATYPYPWDALYRLSDDALEEQWIANNPEVQRMIAEAQLQEQLRKKAAGRGERGTGPIEETTGEKRDASSQDKKTTAETTGEMMGR
jgi:hypothetical protein